MNCEHCQELLPGLERAELPAALQAEVHAHLHSCAECTRIHTGLCELHALLDIEAAPSSGLRPRVLARLQQECAQRNPGRATALSAWFAAIWPSRPAGAFSYSLVLVLCGVLSGQLLPPGTLGVGGAPAVADIPAERLSLLCAVPDPPPNDIL